MAPTGAAGGQAQSRLQGRGDRSGLEYRRHRQGTRITLKKGKTTKKITGTLKKGVMTVKLPKLAKGTWKVTIAWPA